MRISNSFSEGKVQVLEFIVQTLDRLSGYLHPIPLPREGE